jgi:hypothetical protein
VALSAENLHPLEVLNVEGVVLRFPHHRDSDTLSRRKNLMTDGNQRALAEIVFEREQRREREKTLALKMEAEPHAAVIKNMQSANTSVSGPKWVCHGPTDST